MISITIDKIEDGHFIIRTRDLQSVFGRITKRPSWPGIGEWHLEIGLHHSDHGTYLHARNAAYRWARNLAVPPAPKAQPAKAQPVKGRSRRRDPALRPLRYGTRAGG